jgi:hypothetical protein
MTNKRDPITDVPRRIYKSTIDRIDRHLDARATHKGGKKAIKGNFNKFLLDVLNFYEEFQNTPIYYVNNYYLDPSEARGEALMIATKTKQPMKPPMMMVMVGEDDEL